MTDIQQKAEQLQKELYTSGKPTVEVLATFLTQFRDEVLEEVMKLCKDNSRTVYGLHDSLGCEGDNEALALSDIQSIIRSLKEK